MKPLIGISLRTNREIPLFTRYCVVDTFISPIELAGGAPVAIPLKLSEASLRSIYEKMDGLFLPGGVDIHPRHYGEEVAEYCGEIDEDRDFMELTMTRWALSEKKPILAICRGIQLLNVAAGGNLYQDMASQIERCSHPKDVLENRSNLAHDIQLDPDSRTAQALGQTSLRVNSLHHQAVKKIGPGLKVTGRAADGVVEVLESAADQYVVGLQFHPEWLLEIDHRFLNIFSQFITACQKG